MEPLNRRKEKFKYGSGRPKGKQKVRYLKKRITISIDHDLYQITRSIVNASEFFSEAARDFLLSHKFQEYVLKDAGQKSNTKTDRENPN